MRSPEQEGQFEYQGQTYRKKFDGGAGVYRFYENNSEISLENWNVACNSRFKMEGFEAHQNFFVRWREEQRVQTLLSLINAQSSDTIIDVGCHTGNILRHLAGKCQRLIGIDIDPKVIEEAQKTIQSTNIEFHQGDLDQGFDLPDGLADTVLCAETLEHIPDPERGIAELLRIAKPNGKVVIGVPNEAMIQLIKRVVVYSGLGFLLGSLSRSMCPSHLHFFGTKKLMESVGEQAEIITLCKKPPFFTYLFATLKKK